MANANFGGLVVTNTPDPDWVTGWGKRPYMWQTGVAVDREVTSNIQVSLGYYHTTYGNFYVLDNTLVAPTDYSQYCVTAPTDPRLGSVSGQQLCGLYDLNPNKFGQNQSIVTTVSNYGKQTEIYDGVDALGERAAPEADGRPAGGTSATRCRRARRPAARRGRARTTASSSTRRSSCSTARSRFHSRTA